jgi:hypothetical protein
MYNQLVVFKQQRQFLALVPSYLHMADGLIDHVHMYINETIRRDRSAVLNLIRHKA